MEDHTETLKDALVILAWSLLIGLGFTSIIGLIYEILVLSLN